MIHRIEIIILRVQNLCILDNIIPVRIPEKKIINIVINMT